MLAINRCAQTYLTFTNTSQIGFLGVTGRYYEFCLLIAPARWQLVIASGDFVGDHFSRFCRIKASRQRRWSVQSCFMSIKRNLLVLRNIKLNQCNTYWRTTYLDADADTVNSYCFGYLFAYWKRITWVNSTYHRALVPLACGWHYSTSDRTGALSESLAEIHWKK